MLNLKSIAETLTALGTAALIAGCGGSQAPTQGSDVSGQPEDSSPSESSGKSGSSKDSSSQDAVGDVTVSSAFDANGEPIPGADGDISPEAKRPPKQAAPPASASAEPAAAPPKKGGKK